MHNFNNSRVSESSVRHGEACTPKFGMVWIDALAYAFLVPSEGKNSLMYNLATVARRS